MTKVTICIVTWNSEKYIRNCLNGINRQNYKDYELIIVDNNSNDSTLEIVKKLTPYAKIVKNKENLGFCGGHNIGISLSKGSYYMPFNPDIVAEPTFLEKMVQAMELSNEKVGSVSGKLLRYDPLKNEKTNIIDSTGIYFKRNRRSLDRGAEQTDTGQFNQTEFVFGASGAAPLYNKRMLEDIKFENQYFMEYFFAYREDVDLAWRAQHKGWKCIYYPEAVVFHVRNNTPEKRNEMSDFVNMHSVKNRILLIIQNETRFGLFVDGWYFLGYDILILLYVLLKERTSLKAFQFVIKNFKEILKVRKHIIKSSVVKHESFNKWFGRIDSIKFY